MMALALINRPPDAAPGALRELRCRRRACDALLARVIGAVVVCLDGTRLAPIGPGMVLVRRCPKCGHLNRCWL